MLTMIHGDKGGVGKSMVAQVLLDYRIASSQEQSTILVESDTRNPDVSRVFGKYIQVEEINLKSHDGWMELADLLEQNRDKNVVVSLPAGVGNHIETEGQYLSDLLADLGHELQVYWPINRNKDSIILLKEFMESPLGQRADLTVVLNGFFGSQEQFQLWNKSNTRQQLIEKNNGREVFLPELHHRVVDVIREPYTMCKGLQYSVRVELERWLRRAYQIVY